MFNFYNRAGFKLFPCNVDKTPRVSSWRAESAHLSPEEAERITDTGGFVGAWLPSDYVIIDIDRNHGDNVDGLNAWAKLMQKLGIEDDLTKDTLVVKTGSGGMHLYFKLPAEVDYGTLSQKSITESVDVRTHLGYVIAAGTNGYEVLNHAEVAELPKALLSTIQTRNKDKAKEYHPTKELSIERFRKVLNKIEVADFNTNDLWQEFVTSCIAVCGNSDSVLDLIEEWSKGDPNYAEDSTIRKRLDTFEPDGGITVGTFLYILKKQQISKYLIDKVRMEVGAQFTFSESFSEVNEPLFEIDFSKIHDHKEHMRAFYYTRHQSAGVNLFAALVEDKLLYA
ncbi:MAG: bifunctional DNA primase/polymerase, partial [Planctomycetota bacterium]